MQVENAALDQSSALEESSRSTRTSNDVALPLENQAEAGLANAVDAGELAATEDASATSLYAANDVTGEGLPQGLSDAEYDKALDMAKLSSQTYDWDDRAVAGAGMALFSGIGDIKNQDFDTPNYKEVTDLSSGNGIDWWFGKDQGLDYKVFENQETGDMVVAYRGSEPLSAEDWAENAEQVLGSSEQYEQAANLARDMQAELDAYNAEHGTNKQLTFTGHSLGGGLATASALATGSEAIVFDAAGLSQGTIDANNLDLNNASSVTNFNVKGDILSDHNGKQDNTTAVGGLGGVIPDTKQYGETYWLDGVNDRADFGGWLIPDWTNTAKLAESVLNHAWHVFTYQLENKNFA